MSIVKIPYVCTALSIIQKPCTVIYRISYSLHQIFIGVKITNLIIIKL